MKQVNAKLDEPLYKELQKMCKKLQTKSMSQVVRWALHEKYTLMFARARKLTTVNAEVAKC